MSKINLLMTNQHESLLRFMEQKKDKYNIRLRNTNRYSRLQMGYWFRSVSSDVPDGNPDTIALTFWDGTDWSRRCPNLYFGITKNQCFLHLSCNDQPIKAEIFKEMIEELGLEQDGRNSYRKVYSTGSYFKELDDYDHFDEINKFLEGDYEIIQGWFDKKGRVGEARSVSVMGPTIDKWEKNLSRIKDYRDKLEEIDVYQIEWL